MNPQGLLLKNVPQYWLKAAHRLQQHRLEVMQLTMLTLKEVDTVGDTQGNLDM